MVTAGWKVWAVLEGLPFPKCLMGSRRQSHPKPGAPTPALRGLGRRLGLVPWGTCLPNLCSGPFKGTASWSPSLCPRPAVSLSLDLLVWGWGGSGPWGVILPWRLLSSSPTVASAELDGIWGPARHRGPRGLKREGVLMPGFRRARRYTAHLIACE